MAYFSATGTGGTIVVEKTLEEIIKSSTLVAHTDNASYGSGCAYKATEDCYLLCSIGAGGQNYAPASISGYTTLIAGGSSGNWGGAWLVFAKANATVSIRYAYNGGTTASSCIFKLNL